jgi:hypothetical protein
MTNRVYKFLSAAHALDDLSQRRVKVATICDLNDPFDLACADTTHPVFRQALENCIASFNKRVGLLCFSRNWDNILLWSHYAQSHTGICLGFDVPSKQPEDGDRDVAYQPNLLKAPRIEDLNLEFVERLLLTKHDIWAYEQEVRLFVALNNAPDEKGFSWFDFGSKLELREIIVGVQPTLESVASLKQLYERYADRVELWWTYLKTDAFSLGRMSQPPDYLK